MNILFLSDNFPPESNVPATRTFEHAIRWVAKGHEVTVITCAPNFPEGILHRGYKNSWYSVTIEEGIRVVRVKTFLAENEGIFKRAIDHASFMVAGFIAGLFQKKPDIIIATSPQFFTACAGWALAKIKKRLFVFELRDLWPESIVVVGVMKENWVIKGLERLEVFLYKQADLIITVTEGLKNDLIERGIDAGKIKIILNGVDTSRYCPFKAKDSELAELYGLENKFVIGYVGNHGRVYDLFTVLEVAKQFQSRQEVVFIFVGAGVMKNELLAKLNSMNLTNVRMIPKQSQALMPRIYSLCNVSLIPLKNYSLVMGAVSTKMLESLSMGLPVILGMPENSEGARILIGEYACGLLSEPENVQSIINSILFMLENPSEVARFSRNGLIVSEKFSRNLLSERYLSYLEDCLVKNS